MTRSQYIQLLKRQPRLGGTPDTPDPAGPAKDFMDMMKAIPDIAEKYKETGLVKYNQDVAKSYQNLTSELTFFENRNAALNKGLGITSAGAGRLNKALIEVATGLNKGLKPGFKMSNLEMQKYAINMQKMLPTLKQVNATNNEHYKGMIQVQRAMKNSTGLTDEQANSYAQYAGQMEHNAAQQLKFTQTLANLYDKTGTMGLFKQITGEIASAGAEVQIQYGRLPGTLEQSVMKAKKFGFSIKDLAKMGDKMLNIESSIGDELEYQLLSGRRLVNDQGESLTNKMREAALQGDMNKQAETLNEIIDREGESLKNNMFARKQLAKTLGIQENQLASALQKKKILEKAAEAGIDLKLTDDQEAFNEAVQELNRTGKLTAEEMNKFNEDTDLRTTDDLLKEQLTVQREQLMISMMSGEGLDNLRKQIMDGAEATPMGDVKDGGFMGSMLGGVTFLSKIKKEATSLMTKTRNVSQGPTAENAVVTDKALGGAVIGGQPYLVGEQGQELFLPSVNGTIASNSNTTNGTSIKTDNSDVVAAIASLGNIIVTAMASQPASGFNEGRA